MSFKANMAFNSEIMASFLPTVLVSKKKKQTEKNITFFAVSHEFTCINHEKLRKKHPNMMYQCLILTLALLWANIVAQD